MDRFPDSAVQDSNANQNKLQSSLASVLSGSRRSQLLERLRICANLDRQLFLACFHALYTERSSKGLSGLGTVSEGNLDNISGGATDAACNTCQDSPEDTLRNMLTYLHNFDERERTAIDREESLNRQYRSLEAELSQLVSSDVVSPYPASSTLHIPAAQGLSRLCCIEMVISAKEEEQAIQLKEIHHHNFETDGVYLPRLPALLREGVAVERLTVC